MPPVANTPTSVQSTVLNRGEMIQFEASALPNDLIDTMETMTPTFQYSVSGDDNWENNWITEIQMLGSGGNARYVFTLQTPLNSDTGLYDIRVSLVDA